MVVTATAFVAGLSIGALLTHLLLRKELSSRASEAQAIMDGARELAEANLRVAQVNQNAVDRLVVAFGSDSALEVVNGLRSLEEARTIRATPVEVGKPMSNYNSPSFQV